MKRIFKYEITPSTMNLDLPVGARILHVGEQRDRVMLWAEVETEAHTKFRGVMIVGTGWVPPDFGLWGFIGTVQMASGLVWHIYMEKDI